jgi:hypothetical protein
MLDALNEIQPIYKKFVPIFGVFFMSSVIKALGKQYSFPPFVYSKYNQGKDSMPINLTFQNAGIKRLTCLDFNIKAPLKCAGGRGGHYNIPISHKHCLNFYLGLNALHIFKICTEKPQNNLDL